MTASDQQILEQAVSILGPAEAPGWARGGAMLTCTRSATLPLRGRLLVLLHGRVDITSRTYLPVPVSQFETTSMVTVDGVRRPTWREEHTLLAATSALYLAALLLAGVAGLAFVVLLDHSASSSRRARAGFIA